MTYAPTIAYTTTDRKRISSDIIPGYEELRAEDRDNVNRQDEDAGAGLVVQQEQTEALKCVVDLLREIVQAMQAQARPVGQTLAPRGNRPFRLLANTRGLRTMLRWPGFAELWKQEVPVQYIIGKTVHCICGAPTSIEQFVPTKCLGYCGRWFLALDSSVRVHRFPEQVEVD